MKINQETLEGLQKLSEVLSKAFNPMVEALKQFAGWLVENWKWLKSKVVEFYQLEEVKKKYPKHTNKLDFTRSKVQHQVFERKPRHLVRKVIR